MSVKSSKFNYTKASRVVCCEFNAEHSGKYAGRILKAGM